MSMGEISYGMGVDRSRCGGRNDSGSRCFALQGDEERVCSLCQTFFDMEEKFSCVVFANKLFFAQEER